MLKTIIGILVLVFPFLLMIKFKDKKIGFAYILTYVIAFQLIIAIFTQALRIFSYQIILGINLVIIIIIVYKSKLLDEIRRIRNFSIDWILILMMIIAFLHLFSVHYNYSGLVTVFDGSNRISKEVKHMNYPYPYVADEWYAITFAKYSISFQSLPFVNPLMQNTPFFNLEFPFHSFIADLLLILDLNPLTGYTKLTIISGLLICGLIYLFLRINRINKYAAAIASLSELYVTNGANLAGIWTLIPLIPGIIMLILFLIFLYLNKMRMILLALFFTLLFYPPLVIFCALALVTKFITSELPDKEKIKQLSYYLVATIIAALIFLLGFYLMNKTFNNFFGYFWSSKIVYPSLTKEYIPNFLLLQIIPWFILILLTIGVTSYSAKKLWLVNLLMLGLVYWGLYSFWAFRFIIEFERVIVVTAILMVIFSGFGLNSIIDFLKTISFFKKNKIVEYVLIGVMLLFLVYLPHYTSRDNWMELRLVNTENNMITNPAAPANQYLQEEDLIMFKGIKQKVFLSNPWKGTVIGVATDNYASETKEGTISNYPGLYDGFIKANCEEKRLIAQKNKIDYAYSQEIVCPAFELVGKSGEGFYLYKVLKD